MAGRNEPKRWTLDGLKAAIEKALAGYEGPQNGQIRSLPDLRTLRYYATLGVMDRPAEMRGRTAYYGHRHLLQVVAIKRLQSEGYSLSDVQARLHGATDALLTRISRIPDSIELPASSPVEGEVTPSRRGRSFWADVPPSQTRTEADVEPATEAPKAPARRERAPAQILAGVPLVERLHLLFTPTRPLSEDDLRAVRDAAGPILAVLAERGLWAAPAKGELS